ncbi:MAG: hypothetical protein DRH20_14015 [Deltaproteobacteria bacterium]|nr:MAG: hypothetical protein DRH20_14015 [Deltaproteobacteria bacterium]
MRAMEEKIIRVIEEQGPMTGAELLARLEVDGLVLWRACRGSRRVVLQRIGTRYLRLDRRVEGYGRLSPSILREFLTYTVAGLRGDEEGLQTRCRALLAHIREVSRAKLDLAYRTVSALASSLDTEESVGEHACFIIAGDIVFEMAHDVPRPERSTGKLVSGSDMDVVVVVDDRAPESLVRRLDEAIYAEKYRLLVTPHIREEIDYVVKREARVREQVRFDTFRHMVACKILDEGTLLHGSEEIFHRVKALLREAGVRDKLRELEARARAFRRLAEEYLLEEDPMRAREEKLFLFFPTEESEEFE